MVSWSVHEPSLFILSRIVYRCRINPLPALNLTDIYSTKTLALLSDHGGKLSKAFLSVGSVVCHEYCIGAESIADINGFVRRIARGISAGQHRNPLRTKKGHGEKLEFAVTSIQHSPSKNMSTFTENMSLCVTCSNGASYVDN